MPAAGRNALLLTRSLALGALAVAAVSDAHAFAGWIADLGDIDSKQRLWLAAFGGLALGAAFGLLALELRARSTAVSLRRLTDLAAGVDGRMPEATQRQSVATEFARLSDEILYTTQRVARDRREQAAKLASWEAMFAAALDATLALDTDGVIVHVNPAAERLFRIRADEVIGQPFVDVVLPPAHRSPDNACFARELAAGKAQGRRQELVAQRGDGRQFPVEVAIGQLTDGHRIALIVTAHDISMQRRARAELARFREHAQTPAGAHVTKQPAAEHVEESSGAENRAAVGKSAMSNRPHATAARPAFTIDETCGELVRKLAARAERRGLGFRYEDGEVQGLALVGDSSRLRRVLINLIDSVVRVADSGEVVVHVVAVPAEARQVEVTVALSATRLSDAQAARMMKPFATDSAVRRDERSSVAGVTTERFIDFFGTRVAWMRTPDGGATFRFAQRFDIDLTSVSIDLSAPAAVKEPKRATKGRTAAASSAEAQRAKVEFARAATRLRKNADAGNLIALWAEAHRLKGMWLRHGDPANSGLVTALAYTARGGDAENALLLARRFADALEAKAGRDRPATLHDATVAA